MLRWLAFPVILPKVAAVGLVSAPPQFGWLSQLNASALKVTDWRSAKRNAFCMAKFQFWKPGLLKEIELRFWLGNVPFAGRVASAVVPLDTGK